MDRREFIGLAAATAGALAIAGCKSPKTIAPSDWVNLAVIGAGGRGQHMMRMMLRVPGVRITHIADIYAPRLEEGRKLVGSSVVTHSDYHELLAAKDIDAVMVSTPLGLHAEHITAALDSGRPVYGEKSMGQTLAHCNQIRDEVRRTGKMYQVGLQYTYAPWYQEALHRVRGGQIGQVMQIESYWHRNNSWRRPVPKGQEAQLERLLNWRLYNEWSGGLFAELGSHQISFANAVFGTMPESVIASGGIDYWKDGREIADNAHATIRYPGGQTLQAGFITTNRLNGAQERILGTGGSIVLTHTEATYFKEPWEPNSSVPPELAIGHKLITGPTYSAEQPYHGKGDTPISGKVDEPDLLACQAFIDCIRSHQRPKADEETGWAQGVTVALCNHAMQENRRVTMAEFTGSVHA